MPTNSSVVGAAVTALGYSVAGAGVAAAAQVPAVTPVLTWGDVTGLASVMLGLMVALAGTIWTLHQKEIGTLQAGLAHLTEKSDQIQTSINALAVTLAGDYPKRQEVERMRSEMRQELREEMRR